MDCFNCERVMAPMWGMDLTWRCQRCDVIEALDPAFVSRVRTIPEDVTLNIVYIDHSQGHYPSPA